MLFLLVGFVDFGFFFIFLMNGNMRRCGYVFVLRERFKLFFMVIL